MSSSICFTPLISFKAPSKPGVIIGYNNASKIRWMADVTQNNRIATFQALEVKATNSNPDTKARSIVCSKCEGNGAIVCQQCEGNGVNSVDHFNGRFKAGGTCWLCRGKKEILCGDCNGAGFLGGFMSTFDE
ncbi:protein BUNDLE SHEATH DEFECTIVE 2, chloroplastic isoform X2 [Apium graveolens]|uniref:protein BUNDLE SHEATH DEFECTIVE 2, chloroplastic isoform X2 n=1 Tax=Apium graveolens TaxID=4045 RepID=UPI003D79A3CF